MNYTNQLQQTPTNNTFLNPSTSTPLNLQPHLVFTPSSNHLQRNYHQILSTLQTTNSHSLMNRAESNRNVMYHVGSSSTVLAEDQLNIPKRRSTANHTHMHTSRLQNDRSNILASNQRRAQVLQKNHINAIEKSTMLISPRKDSAEKTKREMDMNEGLNIKGPVLRQQLSKIVRAKRTIQLEQSPMVNKRDSLQTQLVGGTVNIGTIDTHSNQTTASKSVLTGKTQRQPKNNMVQLTHALSNVIQQQHHSPTTSKNTLITNVSRPKTSKLGGSNTVHQSRRVRQVINNPSVIVNVQADHMTIQYDNSHQQAGLFSTKSNRFLSNHSNLLSTTRDQQHSTIIVQDQLDQKRATNSEQIQIKQNIKTLISQLQHSQYTDPLAQMSIMNQIINEQTKYINYLEQSNRQRSVIPQINSQAINKNLEKLSHTVKHLEDNLKQLKLANIQSIEEYNDIVKDFEDREELQTLRVGILNKAQSSNQAKANKILTMGGGNITAKSASRLRKQANTTAQQRFSTFESNNDSISIDSPHRITPHTSILDKGAHFTMNRRRFLNYNSGNSQNTVTDKQINRVIV